MPGYKTHGVAPVFKARMSAKNVFATSWLFQYESAMQGNHDVQYQSQPKFKLNDHLRY